MDAGGKLKASMGVIELDTVASESRDTRIRPKALVATLKTGHIPCGVVLRTGPPAKDPPASLPNEPMTSNG